MGLFVPEDRSYDETVRQTGFNRYKQLLSACFGSWFKVNLLTLAGVLPLAAGIACAIAVSSVLVLIPAAFAGGVLAGPFLAGLYDAILRGLRDDPRPWWDSYKRAWRQNWRGSLIPGGVSGLLAGLYAFMGMLFWWAEAAPSPGTLALYLFALLVVLIVNTLYWPQLALFRQKTSIRLKNCLLFCVRYFWRVLGTGVLQLGYLAVFVLFAPWTLVLLPIVGIWYIVFLSQLLIYPQMNEAFHIEELYRTEPAPQ